MLFFLLAGAVALATGSSWSTMSILLPLVVGMSYTLGSKLGLAPDSVASGQQLMVICVAAVLSGAIFGDHCSPISDTTVMSSIATASDHIDHVKTQVPYAISMMAVSLVCGYFPATYFNMSPWICLALGSIATIAIVFIFGKKVGDGSVPAKA
jgi:Na+/H+ antiporter NhaC